MPLDTDVVDLGPANDPPSVEDIENRPLARNEAFGGDRGARSSKVLECYLENRQYQKGNDAGEPADDQGGRWGCSNRRRQDCRENPESASRDYDYPNQKSEGGELLPSESRLFHLDDSDIRVVHDSRERRLGYQRSHRSSIGSKPIQSQDSVVGATMALPSPRNRWRYGLTALACLPPASLTLEKALALVDKGAVPIDKRNHNAKTLADGWDITLWHRLPVGPKAFAGVAVWRYDRKDQHDFRWREDVLVLGFHVGIDDTPATDPGARDAWTRFLLELGDIVRPDFLAIDLYDEFMERKGKDLTREVFAINVYGPSRA